MKKQILSSLFLILCFSLSSQSILDTGSEWHYKTVTGWVFGFNFNKIEIVGDTVIQQKNCKVLSRLKATCDARGYEDYIYKEDGKIYYWEEPKNDFQLLYDFTANEGDTLTIPFWEGFNIYYTDTVFHIRIDSISSIVFDTVELKQFHITYDRIDEDEIDFDNEFAKMTIVEDIGASMNYFYFREDGFCDFTHNIALRCFTHPTHGLIQFTDEACDSVLIVTSVHEAYTEDRIRLYPNPFENHLNLIADEPVFLSSIEIVDLKGAIVYSEIINKQITEFKMDDLEMLESGVYIFKAMDGNRLVKTEKLVKK